LCVGDKNSACFSTSCWGEHIGKLVKKKIVLLGDSAVGKTSLIRRYVIDEFHDHYIETIGTKVSRKDIEMEIEDEEYSLNLQIWDVLGQKAYSAVQSRALVGIDGAIMVADITRKDTLDSIESYWIPTLIRVVGDAPLLFLANKMDLMKNAQFAEEDLGSIASENKQSDIKNHYLTSAKTGDNVNDAFLALSKMVLTSKNIRDPSAEIFEELMAESVFVEKDKTTLIGVTDIIITDFCNGFDNKDEAMKIIRDQFMRAGVSISNPTKTGMEKAAEYLSEEEQKFREPEKVKQRKEKWLRLIRDAKDE
jgi:small GTP-binding protein